MPEKEPYNIEWFSQAVPFLMTIFLSSLGGLVGYLNRIDKTGTAFNLFRFSTEIITSGFVGIITFELCDTASLNWSTTAALVAISGHMGTRALFIVETILIRTITKRYGYEDSKAETSGKEETSK